MTVEKQALVGLKWTGIAKLVGQIISWGVTVLVLRLLVPSDYGLMAIVAAIIGVLASVAEFGFGVSLVQAQQLSRSDLGAVTGAVIISNVSIGVLVTVLAPVAAWFYSEPRLTLLVEVASLHFLFSAVGTVPQALAYRRMNFGWLARTEVVAVVTSGLATLGLAWHGYGVWALLMGSLLQTFIRTALLLSQGMPRPTFRLRGLRQHAIFGGTFTVTRLVSQVAYESDIFIAGRLLPHEAIGLYSVSLHLATLPMQKIMGVINQVILPAAARLQQERERLRLRMIEATRILILFSLPVLWGLSAVAPEFVRTIMGPQWGDAVFPLQIICVAIPLRMLNAVYTTVAIGVGNMRVNVFNTVASAIVLPSTFYVGAHWGADGLAFAWVIAIPFVFFCFLPRVLRIVDLRLSDLLRSLRVPAAAGAFMYAAVGLGRLACEGLSVAVRLPLLIVLGAAVYIGVVLLLDRRVVVDVLRILRAMRA